MIASPAATDCHIHVIGRTNAPTARNQTAGGPLTHQTWSAADLVQVLEANGITNALLVQSSPDNADGRALLAALAQSGGAWRGIAMVDPATVTDAELEALAGAGVVGLRFDLVDGNLKMLRTEASSNLLGQLRDRDWFLAIDTRAPDLPDVLGWLRETGVRVLIEHMGRPDPTLGLRQMGFRDLLGYAEAGRTVIKLSGADLSSAVAFPHADLDRFVADLLSAFGVENCLWGSDWPLLGLDPALTGPTVTNPTAMGPTAMGPTAMGNVQGRTPGAASYADKLALLERWVPAVTDRRCILWDNPARLFGFSAPG